MSKFALNEVPFLRRLKRSCRKPRYGAKPVPAPIIRRGAVGSRGSRKVLWRRKMGTRVPGNFSLRKVLDNPLCRRPVHCPACESSPDAFLMRKGSRHKVLTTGRTLDHGPDKHTPAMRRTACSTYQYMRQAALCYLHNKIAASLEHCQRSHSKATPVAVVPCTTAQVRLIKFGSSAGDEDIE